jgi:GNAT superfamily N-acetyltransferase
VIEVRKLQATDDRCLFRSGNPDLDRFFQKYAAQNQFKHYVGTTYVAVDDGAIVGFVTVAPSAIEVDDLTPSLRRGLPRYPLPVLRVARLAADVTAQGRGVGRLLLRFAFELALSLRDALGCVGVVVDAKDEARAFYEKLGFLPMEVDEGLLGDRPATTPCFLPIENIPESRRRY